MKHWSQVHWNGIVLGAIAGLSVLTLPAIGQTIELGDDSMIRLDNRGPGCLNNGPGSQNGGRGSVNSGSGSIHSGREGDDQHGRQRGSGTVVAQTGDVRQEDRREDRRAYRQADRREDRRSNAGGEVRGLDRADRVAGDHGRQGRDHARDVQSMRASRPERVERPQRPERLERPERAERPQRLERPERMERSGRN